MGVKKILSTLFLSGNRSEHHNTEIINSCAKSAWYARRQHSYNTCKDFLSHNSWMKNLNFTKKYTDHKTICILFGEISFFHSRVMGLYSSNCRRFVVCRAVNWELLGQFTSNFAHLLELIVLRSVYFLVKFRFFIQELWERKSLQVLYECWRRASTSDTRRVTVKRPDPYLIWYNLIYMHSYKTNGSKKDTLNIVFKWK
jgi:hypothetical protein